MHRKTAGGVEECKVIRVVETKAVRGDGTIESPVRLVTQYWDFEGNLLAERDYFDEIFDCQSIKEAQGLYAKTVKYLEENKVKGDCDERL